MRLALSLVVLVCLSAGSALAQNFPALTGRVVDAADILSPETEAFLSQLSEQHEQATGNQVVVATVPSLEGNDIREYGVALGRAWALGREGEDDGVLLLVAPNERKVAIETGYGVEGVLTDAIAKLIIEGSILPRFRQGDFDDGVVRGTQDIIAVLGGDREAVVQNARERLSRDDTAGSFISTIFIAFVLFLALSNIFRRGRRGRRRGRYGPVVLGGGLGGRRGGRGGFGGGGFRGGGGSFGGGGASGGW